MTSSEVEKDIKEFAELGKEAGNKLFENIRPFLELMLSSERQRILSEARKKKFRDDRGYAVDISDLEAICGEKE